MAVESKGGGSGTAPATPKKRSFLGRWVRRLFVLAVLLVIALGVGFKLNYKFDERNPAKKWPWEDTNGAIAYAKDWVGLARWWGKEKALPFATDKMDKTIAWLEGHIKGVSGGGEKQPPTRVVPPGGTPPTPTTVHASSAPESRYLPDMQAAHEALREGKRLHVEGANEQDNQKLLKARTSYQKARDHLEKVRTGMGEKIDPAVDDAIQQVMLGIADINKRLPADTKSY